MEAICRWIVDDAFILIPALSCVFVCKDELAKHAISLLNKRLIGDLSTEIVEVDVAGGAATSVVSEFDFERLRADRNRAGKEAGSPGG